MKRLAPLAASIMAGLASASGAAICSPTTPRPDDRVCIESLMRPARLPGTMPLTDPVGIEPEVVEKWDEWWAMRRVHVPAHQLVLLHDSGPRRQAGDPEPSPVQPVEVSAEPTGSLPVVVPVHERPGRRGMSPLGWALAIAAIMGLVFLSFAPA